MTFDRTGLVCAKTSNACADLWRLGGLNLRQEVLCQEGGRVFYNKVVG